MEQVRVFSKRQSLAQDVILIFGASILLSLFSYIRIPLFFTPVPLVLQNSVAILCGLLLGSKRGALSVLLFLCYGFIGLPVFSTAVTGPLALLSPTGGYLVGYLIAAFFTGKAVEQKLLSPGLALLAGHLTVLVTGTLALSLMLGFERAFLLGFVPFVVTDVLKSVAIARLFKRH